MSELIQLLVFVVVAIIVVWGIQAALSLLAIPTQAKTLVIVIVVLVMLFYLLKYLGLWI